MLGDDRRLYRRGVPELRPTILGAAVVVLALVGCGSTPSAADRALDMGAATSSPEPDRSTATLPPATTVPFVAPDATVAPAPTPLTLPDPPESPGPTPGPVATAAIELTSTPVASALLDAATPPPVASTPPSPPPVTPEPVTPSPLPTGEAAPPADGSAVAVANGAEVYTLNCARCHGDNGTGSFQAAGLLGVGSRWDRASLIAELTSGHRYTFGFADELSPSEIADVVSFVRANFP